MIEITIKDENGNELDETIIIDADYINKSDYLKEFLLEQWEEKYNTCCCNLNESVSWCECEGKYGSGLEISKIES